MKPIIILLILFSVFSTDAQDTLSHSKRFQGGETTILIENDDTTIINRYPNGNLESTRSYTMLKSTTIYKRFYENGKIMWEREMVSGKANGTTAFYNERGKLAASLVFKNDTLIDTNFISSKIKFVYGRGTYYSVVYGGMQREDGSSNISGGHGTYMFTKMYTVKLDSALKEQSVYKEFYTDFNGYYFICLEKGTFGFYPNHWDIKNVDAKIGVGQSRVGGGIQYSWQGGPIQIDKGNMHVLDLYSHSVGYAP